MGEKEESAVVSGGGEQKKKKRKKLAGLILLTVFLILLLTALAICAAAMMKDTVFQGTRIMGLDLGGLTRSQAEAVWEQAAICEKWELPFENAGDVGTVLDRFSLDELGVSVSPKAAAETAWEKCHGGNFLENGWALVYSWFAQTDTVPALTVDEERLQRRCGELAEELNCTVVNGDWRLAEDGLYLTAPQDGRKINAAVLQQTISQQMERRDLGSVLCQFDETQAKTVDLQELEAQLCREMKNAVYDRASGEAGESCIGVDFQAAQLEQEVKAAQPGKEFLTSAKVEYPKVSQEMLKECMFRDVLGTYTTYVSGTWGRRTNVRLAAEMVNGHIYNPGEEFWYNATVGQRTEERGFQAAPAYVAGQTVDEVGGGICQVSSTLYYATLLSDLKIVMRYAHQFAPAYITFGCDATVSWNGPDYAFRNSTDYPIKIVTEYSDSNNLTCTIYGTKTNKNYVKMESYTRKVEDWQTIYRPDENVAPGEEEVLQTPYTGYLVESYRCHYDENDQLIDRVYEDKSDYDKRDKIILRNPYDDIFWNET